MLTHQSIQCPYCGEMIDVAVDASAGDQQYIEDCQVCCRPINLSVAIDEHGEWQVQAWAENEA